MITIRTMKQIATSRTIPGCRSAKSFNGVHSSAGDRARMLAGYAQLLESEARRRWLIQSTMNHRSK